MSQWRSTCVSWVNIVAVIVITIVLQNTEATRTVRLNERPIIGIPTMTISDKLLLKKFPKLKNREYIAAGYVKLMEMTGARVVPIPIKVNDTQLKHVFKSINGMLFPGGETNLKDSGYYKLTKKLFKMAVEANEGGTVFPILGICRGMQAMIVHTVDSIDDLKQMDASNLSLPLKWEDDKFDDSFLKNMPAEMKEDSEKYELTAHFHKYSFTRDVFEKEKIKERFEILATSKDRDDKEFVSILQGKKLPFYGFAFHPEKVLFEWAPTIKIPHSVRAVYLAQFLANTVMAEVRQNTEHKFKDAVEEQMYGILKDPVFYTGFLTNSHSPFMQIYVY